MAQCFRVKNMTIEPRYNGRIVHLRDDYDAGQHSCLEPVDCADGCQMRREHGADCIHWEAARREKSA